MPNYITTTNLVDGQPANADDVKIPLETLDTKVYEALQPMQGASASVDGVAGQVPQPLLGEQEKFLRGDGLWAALDSAALVQSPQIDQMTLQDQDGVLDAPVDVDKGILYLRIDADGNPHLYARLNDGYEYKVSLDPVYELRMSVSVTAANITSETRLASSSALNIDWGDGNQEAVAADTTSSIFHTYAAVGTYQMVVTGGVQDLYDIWLGASDIHQNYEMTIDL